MREGAPVDPGLSLADMLPPDRADESRILQGAFALVAAVAKRTPDGRAEVTVTLDAAGWAALEAERRRYLRPHASYVYAPHPDGAGAVRFVREGSRAAGGLVIAADGASGALDFAPACRDPDCKPEPHPAGSLGCVSDPTCGGTRAPELGAATVQLARVPQCVHAGGPCADPTPHCGFCGRPSPGGAAHPECRASFAAGEGATGKASPAGAPNAPPEPLVPTSPAALPAYSARISGIDPDPAPRAVPTFGGTGR